MAGELITRRDEIEWEGRLFRRFPGSEPGLWQPSGEVTGLDAGEWSPVDPGEVRRRQPRLIGVPLMADSSDVLADLRASMTPRPAAPLVWLGHGWGDELRMVWAEPESCPNPSTGRASRTDEWPVTPTWRTVRDHLVYALDEEEHAVGAGNPLITHAGAAVAPWRMVLPGPVSGPRIRNIDEPTFVWRWDDLVLTGDQTLEVDSRARTALVLEDGEDPVSVWAMRAGDGGSVPLDWGILPAGTHVGFARISGTSVAELHVRPAW